MAGGTFDINVSKKRPGNYTNFKSKKKQKATGSTRGTALIPLIGYDWGPNATFLTLTAEAPDAEFAKLGRSIYDDNDFMLLIREAFKNATKVLVYIINPGTKASVTAGGMTITASHPGTRGNSVKVACVANTDSKFDVTVFLGTDKVEEYLDCTTIASLITKSKETFVKFTAADTSANLTAFASISLASGTDGTVTNTMITNFLDASENENWDAMAFPTSTAEQITAAKTKANYLRNDAGKRIQIVMANCSGDAEGVINVTNSVALDTKSLTAIQATAWVAGATAAASKVKSLTYMKYEGATAVVDKKNKAASDTAIDNGEFFFSTSEEGDVIVEYDINSLHTFTTEKTKDYSKNRVIRVYDSFAKDLAINFPPNKYDNSLDGWLLMEGVGRALLQQYEEEGAITEVDLENDFYVDQSRSQGDETYFNIGIKAVDSSEKHYFSISTR